MAENNVKEVRYQFDVIIAVFEFYNQCIIIFYFQITQSMTLTRSCMSIYCENVIN